ncbi:MAG: hypothetical protein GY790_17905, partial [Bacteroidetes bacterium]|nr:hypothetical protein [Bacteroidota bacterium]
MCRTNKQIHQGGLIVVIKAMGGNLLLPEQVKSRLKGVNNKNPVRVTRRVHKQKAGQALNPGRIKKLVAKKAQGRLAVKARKVRVGRGQAMKARKIRVVLREKANQDLNPDRIRNLVAVKKVQVSQAVKGRKAREDHREKASQDLNPDRIRNLVAVKKVQVSQAV